jgi:PadR family transcriptional regulator, regulatory protein PadR
MSSQKTFLGEFEQMVLLAILRTGDRAFGLEVRRELETKADRTVSRGAFYTTLDRLEGKGFLSWTEMVPPGGRTAQPLRRYRLTSEGLDALRASRRAFEALSDGLESVWEGA